MESKLTNEGVAARIQEQFGTAVVSVEMPYDMLTMEIAADQMHDVIEWIKSDAELQIGFLTLLGGVHYPNDKGREFAMVYHLHSWTNNFRIRLKAFLPAENPSIATLTDIYDGANWMERETYDFFGIHFDGHPNLVRILNEDTMDYFPMRKEYHLEDATREDKDDRYFGR
jgi:NADH-quinone oxidoreductase subunit C